ncbi:MAG: hypothetical protein PHG82_00305 [Candidatus Gracilibacteria bacterium]|nr:hypothetical protein [Candidatus Gracilibacteria bacterium]
MSYKLSAKNRKFKAKIIKILRALKFRGANSSAYFKLLIIGNILVLISLFLVWSYSTNLDLTNTAFSSLTGYIGYFIILNSGVNLFFLLSSSSKEKLKLNSPMKINEPNIFLAGAIFQILTIFMVFSFTKGLFAFSENIVFGNGIIIAFVGAIINFAGAISMIKTYKDISEDILFSNETSSEISDINNGIVDKNNMKLPF